ncbi:MAG TPA: S8 family serine peptidase [Candidatus Limnocylindrales bacterium]|nr:S8 family serine peptidase [Candidatus Limnocylindrales bacterium]
MPRVASAALALLFALAAAPLGTAAPVAASAAPPLQAGAGAVEPSAKADPKDRWIVVYRDGADVKQANGRAKGRGIAMDRKYSKALKGYAAKLTGKQLAQVKADPDVAFVAQDGIIRAQGQTIPRGIRRVDALRNTTAKIDGVDERVDADVAIFDTGIDKSHPDLNVVGGYNCSSTNRLAWGDGNGHGTHVAGTVGALDNGIGAVGVAPGVRLWAVRILGSDGSGLVSWYVCGMDWIAGQRDPVDPGRPLIEAVNMSVAKTGSDDRNCGYTNKDAMHKAICRLVAAGVTVIAAAGNNSFSASRLIPASYNEVITVSALADTDGLPGGTGGDACYSWGTYDSDDTYANFSNYGADVDIMAPGKCIWSTLPGGRYGYSSGTSMAAPHVTGAVALWLSTRPGRTPLQAKAALQAAATLDWKTSTDPDGKPDRLLNVAHLVDAGDFHVDAGRVTGWTNAAGRSVSVPVEAFRAEDFPAELTLQAVPDAPLTATLGDRTFSADERTTKATITVPPKTPSGTYKVVIRASDGSRTRSVTVKLKVDSDKPVAAAPAIATPDGKTMGTRSALARLRWAAATDATNKIAGYQVSWRVDGGSWSTATSIAAGTRHADRTFSTGHTYEARVRAKDAAGNWSPWATLPATSLGIAQDTSGSIVRSGTWKSASNDSYSGGTSIYAKAKGASLTRTFTGRAVAWAATLGPTRGSARVYIDGALFTTVSQYRSKAAYRRIVFERSWAKTGTHTIRIEVAGTSGHPRVDLDALIVIR